MTSLLHDILGADGAIARRLGKAYEFRPQQMEMASAVEQALAGKQHLLAEAGTGVGKSFAYLLPAIDFAVKNRKRLVISTHTISLQEQLIGKDIPLLQSVYPDEFTAILVKGRGNYLCRRRLEQAWAHMGSLFDGDRQQQCLESIEQWAGTTTDGSLADLPFVPDGDVWERVCAEQGNCLGKNCPFYEGCHWQAARRRMYSGKILIVNHALFFSDLSLRMNGVNYLPKYDAVVLDEAHTLEDVAGEHFGLRIGEGGVRYLLRTLYDPKRSKGLLSTHGAKANDAIRDVVDLYDRSQAFFARCLQWHQQQGKSNGRLHQPNWVEDDLSPKMRDLSLHLKAMLADVHTEDESIELTAMAEKVANAGEMVQTLVSQSLPDAVYWMAVPQRANQRLSLHGAPIAVAPSLKTYLFDKVGSVIMASATLCTGGSGGQAQNHSSPFDYIKSRLGVEKAQTLQLGSPFDYPRQATLYIHSDLPDPSDPMFLDRACQRILQYLRRTSGGAFVLFTSYSMLNSAAARLGPDLRDLNLPLLVQGQGPPPRVLLDRFRKTPNAVLFGTSSFWQGIDVQGDQLRNVIIVKLPFSVPDEPVVEARLDAIKRRGGNPFMEYSLPEAIIRLKQGFGRLIRSKTDRGIVVILDSRLTSKRYGKMFIDALPPCRKIQISAE